MKLEFTFEKNEMMKFKDCANWENAEPVSKEWECNCPH